MRAERRYVHLWSIPHPTIVVPGQTGIVYCNQTDGVACVQRELEGWLLPLPRCEADVFDPEWWERRGAPRDSDTDEVWPQVVRQIEAAVRAAFSGGEAPLNLQVIRHPDNSEAWVHVSFLFPDLGPTADGHEPVPLRGVLTWENSD